MPKTYIGNCNQLRELEEVARDEFFPELADAIDEGIKFTRVSNDEAKFQVADDDEDYVRVAIEELELHSIQEVQ